MTLQLQKLLSQLTVCIFKRIFIYQLIVRLLLFKVKLRFSESQIARGVHVGGGQHQLQDIETAQASRTKEKTGSDEALILPTCLNCLGFQFEVVPRQGHVVQ